MKVKLPFIIPGLGSTNVAKINWCEDVYSSNVYNTELISADRAAYVRLEKCRIIGNNADAGEYGIKAGNYTGPIDIINCTIDSCYNGIEVVKSNVKILNTIISRCNTGINGLRENSIEGLIIHGCSTDTANCYVPITYSSTDPQLDAERVAQADLTGVNSLYNLEAPVYDDLGHCFRVDSDTPHIGWRSKHTETTCCSGSGGGENVSKWEIRTSGRRLR